MMRSSWRPSEDDLAVYASGPITYEMEMIVKQLEALRSIRAAPIANALIEAVLVHLRLLDDFLGSQRQTGRPTSRDLDDVYARHWLATWQPARFLSDKQISDINAQLTHLAARRQHWNFPWDLHELAAACGARFEEFCVALEASSSTRAAAFSKAREYAAKARS